MNVLALFAALSAAGVVIGSIRTVALSTDPIVILSRCTAAVALMALSSWLDGSPAGVLGAVVTVVLVAVLAIAWCVRQERPTIPVRPDWLYGEDGVLATQWDASKDAFHYVPGDTQKPEDTR